ncbi:MAG: hypothetical protein ACTSVZ_11585 [Promethearchaeota archaeon]
MSPETKLVILHLVYILIILRTLEKKIDYLFPQPGNRIYGFRIDMDDFRALCRALIVPNINDIDSETAERLDGFILFHQWLLLTELSDASDVTWYSPLT